MAAASAKATTAAIRTRAPQMPIRAATPIPVVFPQESAGGAAAATLSAPQKPQEIVLERHTPRLVDRLMKLSQSDTNASAPIKPRFHRIRLLDASAADPPKKESAQEQPRIRPRIKVIGKFPQATESEKKSALVSPPDPLAASAPIQPQTAAAEIVENKRRSRTNSCQKKPIERCAGVVNHLAAELSAIASAQQLHEVRLAPVAAIAASADSAIRSPFCKIAQELILFCNKSYSIDLSALSQNSNAETLALHKHMLDDARSALADIMRRADSLLLHDSENISATNERECIVQLVQARLDLLDAFSTFSRAAAAHNALSAPAPNKDVSECAATRLSASVPIPFSTNVTNSIDLSADSNKMVYEASTHVATHITTIPPPFSEHTMQSSMISVTNTIPLSESAQDEYFDGMVAETVMLDNNTVVIYVLPTDAGSADDNEYEEDDLVFVAETEDLEADALVERKDSACDDDWELL